MLVGQAWFLDDETTTVPAGCGRRGTWPGLTSGWCRFGIWLVLEGRPARSGVAKRRLMDAVSSTAPAHGPLTQAAHRSHAQHGYPTRWGHTESSNSWPSDPGRLSRDRAGSQPASPFRCAPRRRAGGRWALNSSRTSAVVTSTGFLSQIKRRLPKATGDGGGACRPSRVGDGWGRPTGSSWRSRFGRLAG